MIHAMLYWMRAQRTKRVMRQYYNADAMTYAVHPRPQRGCSIDPFCSPQDPCRACR